MEVVWVLIRARGLFLSLSERVLYGVASGAGLASCVLGLGACLWFCARSLRAAQVARVAWSVTFMGLSGWLFWSLSQGRRVQALAARPYVVVALALSCGALAWLLALALASLRARATARIRWLAAALLVAAQLAVLAADMLILPRGYPAFHGGLCVLAILLASATGLSAPRFITPAREQRALVVAGLMLLVAPFALLRLASNPTAGFAVRETAPWSARLMRLVAPVRARDPQLVTRTRAADSAPVSGQKGVELRDRDVLLITVDALRADMLRAYGGTGGTPELDRLAAQSAVFMRAYTPAPHTSYALASLLTGKFVKPLVELGEKLGDPPTLPDRLRRYGYRTAAFYPPAIFFVDGASFEPLQKRGFGFEYRKEMFASAPDRVAQLSEYLAQADVKRPLFAWVHLFEPHEPYDPPVGSARPEQLVSERGRYEAEVAVCDRAIAELVRVFRAARPNATVIVTADHGEEFGDHGGSFHGTSLYDEQVRIPLLWSSPGVVSPRRIDVPVELTDVGTTILSTAGIPRDAHMRGDELDAVLAGRAAGQPRFAFASIDARHMITDGRLKLICGASDVHCALFDLVRDRAEALNLSASQPEKVAQLRGELDLFLASISRAEAITVSQGVRMPEVLARAKLGGTVTVDELVPLLSDARVAVRLEAARALGELGSVRALPALGRARAQDDDALVRGEAAIAALQLGEPEALPAVLALSSETSADIGRARRVALALARAQRSEAVPVLAALIVDESATENDRSRAVRALGQLGSPLAVEPVAGALQFVRLREVAAEALGQLGGAEALAALRAQLQQERYPPARAAEARALVRLGDPAVPASLRHFLGMESSLPHGVQALAALGALSPSGRAGALLSDAGIREGSWRCDQAGCAPEAGARVKLPPRGVLARGPVRVTVWYRDADPGAALTIDGQRFPLQTRDDQVSLLRSSGSSAERLSFAREGELRVVALAVVPAVDEIPPPAPEPWEADSGTAEAAPNR